MDYYIYENWVAEKTARIHKEDCSFCNFGKGTHENIRGNQNGKWHGPFSDFKKAYNKALSLNDRSVKMCLSCKPEEPEVLFQAVYEKLKSAAKAGDTVSYGEIAPLLGLDMSLPEDRGEIGEVLGEISTFEHQRGRPMLSAVVVLKGIISPARDFST